MVSVTGSYKDASIAAQKRLLQRQIWHASAATLAGSCGHRNRRKKDATIEIHNFFIVPSSIAANINKFEFSIAILYCGTRTATAVPQ